MLAIIRNACEFIIIDASFYALNNSTPYAANNAQE